MVRSYIISQVVPDFPADLSFDVRKKKRTID